MRKTASKTHGRTPRGAPSDKTRARKLAQTSEASHSFSLPFRGYPYV